MRKSIIRFLSALLRWVDNGQLKISNDFLTNCPESSNFHESGGHRMPHSALSVANATLDLAWGDQGDITPLKLQKFVYICHGFCLALTGDPLIEQKVHAWDYGPVIPIIYHAFKRFGKRPIDEPASVMIEDKPLILSQPEDDLTRVLIRGVWDIYGSSNGYQLANMTHEKDTPWHQTWQNGIGKNLIISNELIKEYYQKQLGEVGV